MVRLPFFLHRIEVNIMAATRLIALHINKGKSVAQCLRDRTDYAQNPEKTEKGELVTAYECDPMTADQEFLLSKRQYEYITGRRHKRDVIAYQIRQSFKPGEITPEEANTIGQELARRFTKGKHAFIVATHVDRAHIHNHIIFNSTSLDCTRKFRDFHLSGLALARLSDMICLEHRLSVITPKPYRERTKYKYPERLSLRDQIRSDIDAALSQKPRNFEELVELLKQAGYEYQEGKHPAIRGKSQKMFIRFRSLGAGYTPEDLASVFAGDREHQPHKPGKRAEQPDKKINLLIDIQAKMAAGKGTGYVRWAKVFNLKQMSKALIFLQENGIESMEQLNSLTAETVQRTEALKTSIRSDEARLAEIAVLRGHILNYVKTREIYQAYKASGFSKTYFETHRQALTLHKAAKEAFNEQNLKKLPRIRDLNAEYAQLLEQKKKTYAEYRQQKTQMQDWLTAQKIGQVMLDEKEEQREEQKKETENRNHAK